MKKLLIPLVAFTLIACLFISTLVSCKKETVTETITKTDTIAKCVQNIQGLWVGTYTVGAGQPVPSGTQFYFSFSIYPNGTMSYKSKGYYNGSSEYITFADGTWTLNGTNFSFNVRTVNVAGSTIQRNQFGTATFNITNGTLTNGIIADAASPNSTTIWSMNRVN